LRIRTWVEKNFSWEWSLGEMAQTLSISRFYMCHLFKKEFGISILEYRNSLRLTMAKKLLVSTEKKIGSIATECGFGTASYFSEVFQASEGIAPGTYRQLHK
ncbi:MAG: helix-turn-helix transcriptional regulator, partial [Lachnospiraceae bacterium]|nr:helix-turn-helix transcriptional regulator [Lachnospiraceae bacterium]